MKQTAAKLVQRAVISASALIASFLLVGLTAGPATAQGAESSASPDNKFLTLLGIHSATVAPRGVVFGGASRSFNLDGEDAEEDTGALIGFGLGDANNGLGLQFTVTANSETDTFDSFGYLGVKGATRLQSANAPTYVGLAIDRIGGWGEAEDVENAASIMVTRFGSLEAGGENYPVIMTLGAGTHASDLTTEPGIFIGAGVGLSRNLGVSAAWNGEWVELGTGFKVDAIENLTVTLAVADAFNEVERQQLSIGLSWFFDAGSWR
jgi:hypothetical protein